MPELIRPKDVAAKVHTLSEKERYEMYARLLPRAMETNPLREWRMSMNPTVEDLKDVLMTLSPSDMNEITDTWF